MPSWNTARPRSPSSENSVYARIDSECYSSNTENVDNFESRLLGLDDSRDLETRDSLRYFVVVEKQFQELPFSNRILWARAVSERIESTELAAPSKGQTRNCRFLCCSVKVGALAHTRGNNMTPAKQSDSSGVSTEIWE